jgi:hypothetical protein
MKLKNLFNIPKLLRNSVPKNSFSSHGFADLFAVILLAFSAVTIGTLALNTLSPTQNQNVTSRIAGNVPNGESCKPTSVGTVANNLCESKICIQNSCRAHPNAPTEYCDEDSDCSTNDCFKPTNRCIGKVPPYKYCEKNSNCTEGFLCINNLCNKPVGEVGQSCDPEDGNIDCGTKNPYLICDSTTETCQLSGECSEDADCPIGSNRHLQICVNSHGNTKGICIDTNSRNPGQYCDATNGAPNNFACSSGYCDSSTLMCTPPSGGETTNAQINYSISIAANGVKWSFAEFSIIDAKGNIANNNCAVSTGGKDLPATIKDWKPGDFTCPQGDPVLPTPLKKGDYKVIFSAVANGFPVDNDVTCKPSCSFTLGDSGVNLKVNINLKAQGTGGGGNPSPDVNNSPGGSGQNSVALSSPGYCAKDSSGNTNADPKWYKDNENPSCNFADTFYTPGAKKENDTYCAGKFGGQNGYFYACPRSKSGARIICGEHGGVDGASYPNGYRAPICLAPNVPPSASTISDGLFQAYKAQNESYKDNLYYDAFVCEDKGASGQPVYDFVPKDGLTEKCNEYPWTQDESGTIPKPPPGSGKTCDKKEAPYWDGKECAPRPYACKNTGPSGKTNNCIPKGQEDKYENPDVVSGIPPEESNELCTRYQNNLGNSGKYVCGGPLKNGSSTTPPPSSGGTPLSGEGKSCNYGGQNTCASPLKCVPKCFTLGCGGLGACCPDGKSWDNTNNKCISPGGNTTNPPSTGGNTGGARQNEHCYNGNSDCAKGYYCTSGDTGTANSYCLAYPPSNSNSMCPSSQGFKCVAPFSKGGNYETASEACANAGMEYYTGNYWADDACRTVAGSTQYCCMPKSSSSQPPVGGQKPEVSGPPSGFPENGSSCTPPSDGSEYLGGTYCVNGQQVDAYCRNNVTKYEQIGKTCKLASSTSSSKITSHENSCSTNIECLQNKTGSACVFYAGSASGTCKAN